MDPISLIAAIPSLAKYAPEVALGGYICSMIASALPAPGDGASRAYRVLYRVINVIAINIGHARNAADPALKS